MMLRRERPRRASPLGALQSFLETHPRIVLFGAGKNGEFVRHFLEYLDVDLECFIDNAPGRVGTRCVGVEVRDPSCVPGLGAGIIVTTEKFAPAMTEQLIALGVPAKDIHVIRQVDLNALFRDDPEWPRYVTEHYFVPYYRAYFEGRGIDCTGEELTSGPFRFPNPFREGADYQVSFFSEICDYVLPALCNDVSMLAEGPAEHGGATFASGDTVLDAGANVGLFSMVAAAKGARVFAFEPLPEVIGQLEKAVDLFPDIRIEPCALSNSCGRAEIAVSVGKNTCNSLVLPAGPDRQSVNAVTIDAWVRERGVSRVDFIKADIEGAERLMLQGARETLRSHSPRLSICTYHLADDREVLEEMVRDANPSYQIEHRWQKMYAFVP